MSTNSKRHTKEKVTRSKPLPARTGEGRMNQLVDLAVELAEQRLRDGSASSQIIVTLLNYGTAKFKLEMEKLKSELELSDAKIKHMQMQETSQQAFEEAMEAFKSYKGDYSYDDYGEYGDEY